MLTADQLLAIVWKRRWTFLSTFALVVAAAVAVTATLPNVYRTASYLLVSSTGQAANDYEATQTNQVLAKTYSELLQTRAVADAVADRLSFETSGSALAASVEIEPITQSQLISITAEETSPERAKEIADTYAQVFVERAGELTEVGSARVSLAEPASLIDERVRPRPKLYTAIGVVLALLAATGAALLRHRLDQRLEIEPASTELLGLPILGRIPQRASQRSRDAAPDAQLADAFRLVLANLTFANLGERPRSLAVVSAGQAEGKSTCSLHIARAATELGIRVLLVDGDLRRPGLSNMLRGEIAEGSPGFSSMLLAPERFAPSMLPQYEGDASLRVVTAGPIPPNPAALLGKGLPEFVRAATETFELVIFDTPPLLVGADASLIASRCEGVVLVVDAANTKRTALTYAVDQLRRAQSNVLGVMLNRTTDAATPYYYYQASPETAADAFDAEPATAARDTERARA